jgi:hypothetical protein
MASAVGAVLGRRFERAERVGDGVHSLVGRRIKWQKFREAGGPLALDGRHLKGGHNNQIKVGFDVGGDVGVGEERRLGRNVWGGVVSRNRTSNGRRKKIENKTRRGLRWLPTS